MLDPSKLSPSKRAEIADGERSAKESWVHHKPFAVHWGNEYFVKWATIAEILEALALAPGSRFLDVGCGVGWTSCFLAESGYRVTGVDIAAGYLEAARMRAERWGVPATFVEADMDDFDLGPEPYDGVLFFDALHHTDHRAAAVANAARHLRPGGWMIFGEPSLLHHVSPRARRVSREQGWVERGISLRALKADCRKAGLGNFRRFHEGTRPHERSLGAGLWQLVRLVAMNVWAAPQAAVWLAAQRL